MPPVKKLAHETRATVVFCEAGLEFQVRFFDKFDYIGITCSRRDFGWRRFLEVLVDIVFINKKRTQAGIYELVRVFYPLRHLEHRRFYYKAFVEDKHKYEKRQ